MEYEDFKDARNEIRDKVCRVVPCTDYLIKAEHGGWVCPFCGHGTHKSKTGAVKYHKELNRFYCNACKKSGDVIDAAMYSMHCDYTTALKILAKDAGEDLPEHLSDSKKNAKEDLKEKEGLKKLRESAHGQCAESKAEDDASHACEEGAPETAVFEERTSDYTEYYERCKQELFDSTSGWSKKALQYLADRKISTGTVRKYGIGFDSHADPANSPGGVGELKHPAPRIILPCTKDYYVARAIEPNAKYKKLNPKGSRPVIFNLDVLSADVGAVFVVEGIFDALSVIETGSSAIALNSAANTDLLLRHLKEYPTKAVLILCFDHDPDPQTRKRVEEGRDQLGKGLKDLSCLYIEADICGPYKDADEYLKHDANAFSEAVCAAVAKAQEARDAEKSVPEAEETKEDPAPEPEKTDEETSPESEKQEGTASKKSFIDQFMEDIYSERYKPIPTGLPSIDKLLQGGLISQTLIIIGAEPGAGKTSLCTMIFESIARSGRPVLYLCLEMSREQLLARSLSRLIYLRDQRYKLTALDILQGYKHDDQTRQMVADAAQEYRESIDPYLDYAPEDLTTDATRIIEHLRKIGDAAKKDGRPAPHVCLDYLQYCTGEPKEDSSSVIKRVVAGLKSYAVDYDAVAVCISAQNRTANELGKKGQPIMEAGRDSSAIEYSADMLIQMSKAEELVSGEGADFVDVTKMYVTKSRFTKTNILNPYYFLLHGGQSYLEEIDRSRIVPKDPEEDSKKKSGNRKPEKPAQDQKWRKASADDDVKNPFTPEAAKSEQLGLDLR